LQLANPGGRCGCGCEPVEGGAVEAVSPPSFSGKEGGL
jgi:hypothetical protein